MPANNNSARTKEWYQETIEARRAYARAWYHKNKEKILPRQRELYDKDANTQRMREYRSKYKEKCSEYRAKYRAENREYFREVTAEWRRNNPDKDLEVRVASRLRQSFGGEPPAELVAVEVINKKLRKIIKEKSK